VKRPMDPVKLLLFIVGGIVLLAFLAFASRRHHRHEIPEVEIQAEPSPAAMPTGLPLPEGRP